MNLKKYFVPKKFLLVNYLRPIVPMIVLSFFFLLPNSMIINFLIDGNIILNSIDFWILPILFIILESVMIFMMIKYISFAKEFFKNLVNISIPLYFIHLVIFFIIRHGMKFNWLKISNHASIPLLIGFFSIFAGFIHGNYFSYLLNDNKKKLCGIHHLKYL